MSDADDLRGSTPVYTAKDILVRLDDKVDKMDLKLDGVQTAVQIIVSQNLNERVVQLESRVSEFRGAQTTIKALFGTSALTALIGGVALLKTMGIL